MLLCGWYNGDEKRFNFILRFIFGVVRFTGFDRCIRICVYFYRKDINGNGDGMSRVVLVLRFSWGFG